MWIKLPKALWVELPDIDNAPTAAIRVEVPGGALRASSLPGQQSFASPTSTLETTSPPRSARGARCARTRTLFKWS